MARGHVSTMILALGLALLAAPAVGFAEERRFALSDASDGVERLELRGEADEAAFNIVVPPLGSVVGATIDARWENGVDVLPEASRLTVIVNDQAVAELPMTAFRGAPMTASIKIPADRVRVGMNRVVLRQDAVNRAACRPNGAFDLWTRLDLVKSALVLSVDGGAPPPDLSRLETLWAAGDIASEPLVVATAGRDARADHLGWGSLIAGAYGRVPGDGAPRVVFTVAEPRAVFHPRGVKTVLVGTAGELSGLVPKEALDRVAGPHLAILQVDGAILTLVTGRTAEEVDTAAIRLGDRARPLPTETWLNLDPTPRAPAPTPAGLTPKRTTLAELGMSSVEHTGFRYVTGVDVTLPADFKPVADRTVTMRVDGAFDGDLGPGAKLSILVDGRTAGVIEIDRRSSPRLEHAEVRLPMTLFRAGRNRLTFEAEMPPHDEGDCLRNVRKPRFVLRDTTSLEFADFARVIDLPDLGITARTGAPLVGVDDRPFDLIVTNDDPRWTGAALTLVARLARVSPALPRVVPFVGPHDPGGRNAVIVGPVDSLPNASIQVEGLGAGRLAALLDVGARLSQAGASMSEDEKHRVIVAALGAGGERPGTDASSTDVSRWERAAGADPKPAADQPTSVARGVLAGVLERLGTVTGVVDPRDGAADPIAALMGGHGAPEAALIQFEGESGSGATRVVLTAVDAAAIARATRRLVSERTWAAVGGAVTLWRDADEAPIVVRALRGYRLIETPADIGNMLLIAATYLSRRVEVLFGLLLICVFVLAITAHLLLRRGRPGRE